MNGRIFIKFPSHRARQYTLAALTIDMPLGQEPPQAYYISFVSPRRNLKHYGIYSVTEKQLAILQSSKRERARVKFTVLRPPYDDLMRCW